MNEIEEIIFRIQLSLNNVNEHVSHKDYNDAMSSLSEIKTLCELGKTILVNQ